MPFMIVDWIEIYVPILVLRVVWLVAKGDSGMTRARRLTAALNYLEAWEALCPSRMSFW